MTISLLLVLALIAYCYYLMYVQLSKSAEMLSFMREPPEVGSTWYIAGSVISDSDDDEPVWPIKVDRVLDDGAVAWNSGGNTKISTSFQWRRMIAQGRLIKHVR